MKPRSLATRLRGARSLLRVWQSCIRDSHVRRIGPQRGTVPEDARAAITEAIARVRS